MTGNKIVGSRFLLLAGLSFIAGIFFASWTPVDILKGYILFYFAAGLTAFVLSVFTKSIRFKTVFFSFGFLLFAVWRFAFVLPQDAPNKIWHYNGTKQIIIATVDSDVVERDKTQMFAVRVLEIENIKTVGGDLLVYAPVFSSYQYGDLLKLECDLKGDNENIESARYFEQEKFFSFCFYPKIGLLERGQGNKIQALILSWKNKIRENINFGLTEPFAGVERALLLGDNNYNQDLKLDFASSGIIHMIAISGSHISLFAALIVGTLFFLGLSRILATWITIGVLISYVALIGFPASAARALIMGFLVLWALAAGRFNQAWRGLVFSAAVLLAFNPELLRYDLGFQFSFLSTLGLILYYPMFKNFGDKVILKKNILIKYIMEAFNMTLAAQILILPFLIFKFSQISLIAPLTNILVLWTFPILIIVSLFAILATFLFSIFAPIFFLPVLLLLNYVVLISHFYANIPFGSIEIDYWPWRGFVIYYLACLWGWRKLKRSMGDTRQIPLFNL